MNVPHTYPEAGAVLRAFLASGRRHLILTGSRNTGKSTLLKSLCGEWNYPGITTNAVPKTAVTMTDHLTGAAAVVGRYDPTLPGTEQKMRPTDDGFAVFGVELLRRCADAPGDIVTLDEIGYLELGCRVYLDALNALMKKKRLIAVVRKQAMPQLGAYISFEDAFVLDLDAMYGQIGCVIMASGLGVRFGGNKLMADFGGEPMIARILDATDGIFARRVVVTRHKEVAAYCGERHVDVVLHDLPHRNDTVRLGLEAIGSVRSCMFCPGDQPLLQRSTVAALTMASAGDTASIYRAADGETVGAPVVFPAWTFHDLMHLPDGKGGGFVAKQYPQSVKVLSVLDRLELTDADTKESLQFLVRAQEEVPAFALSLTLRDCSMFP